MGLEGLGLADAGRRRRASCGDAAAVAPGEHARRPAAEGYLHGMNTVAEAVLQLQGRAGARTVAGAETCVVTSGALMDGSALVLAVDR